MNGHELLVLFETELVDRPLRFGDPDQVYAVRMLSAAEYEGTHIIRCCGAEPLRWEQLPTLASCTRCERPDFSYDRYDAWRMAKALIYRTMSDREHLARLKEAV